MEKKNQKGTSLIGVIIAGSMLTVIGLVSAQMIQNQLSAVTYLEDKLAKVDFKGVLIGKLNDRDTCSQSVIGLPVQNEQELVRLRERNGDVAYSTDDPATNSFEHLSIEKMTLHNVSLPSSSEVSGEMKLTIFAKRKRAGGGPQDMAPFDVALIVQTDSSGLIVSCKAYGDGSGNTAQVQSCDSLPAGVTSPSSPPFEEGTLVADATKNYLCINTIWASLDRAPASTTTTSTTGGSGLPSGCSVNRWGNGISCSGYPDNSH